MTRRQVMRLVSAILGGIVVALAFLAGVLVLNSRSGLSGSTAATAAGWTIPVLAGIVAGVVAWVLLIEDRSRQEEGSGLAPRCSDCGRPMADEWRLCPYCGALNESEAESGAYSAAGDVLR